MNDGYIKTEIALRDEIHHLFGIINSYFKEGTTHEQKILWIRKQIEFRNEANRELKSKIEEERNELRHGLRKVKALRIILRRTTT